MRVPQLCSDVKAEVTRILNHTLAQSDTVHTPYKKESRNFDYQPLFESQINHAIKIIFKQ